jgi:hypothetical protein
MPEPTKRLKIPTFPVHYWSPEDGSLLKTEEVRAVPLLGTDGRAGQLEAIEIQDRIIEYVVYETAAIGAMVVDPKGLELLKIAAAMMWVLGKPESERGISLNNLLNAGDYVQIGQIFVSKTYNEDRIITPFDQPSHFAEVHKMDYWGKFYRTQEEKAAGIERAAVAKIEQTVMEPATTKVPIDPPKNTPLLAADVST